MLITGTGSYFYWRKYFSVAISGTLVLTDAGGNTSNNWVYAYGLLRIDLHNFIVKVCARMVELAVTAVLSTAAFGRVGSSPTSCMFTASGGIGRHPNFRC